MIISLKCILLINFCLLFIIECIQVFKIEGIYGQLQNVYGGMYSEAMAKSLLNINYIEWC